MISKNPFIEGFISTSSSESMKASRMYASLSFLVFLRQRRHSSSVGHQITNSLVLGTKHIKKTLTVSGCRFVIQVNPF